MLIESFVLVIRLSEMDEETIFGMLVNLGSLMRQNGERLNAIAHLNPSQEQLLAFQDYQDNINQLIMNLIKPLVENDPEQKNTCGIDCLKWTWKTP